MGRPGYYTLDDPSIVEFPRAERIGSNLINRQRTDLIFETEEGVIWPYPQIRRRMFWLNFRVNESQLEVWDALDLLVDGLQEPFYFVPDTDAPGTAILVRKEQNFEPKQLDERGVWDGVEMAVFDYAWLLKEEVPNLEILP